LRLWGAASGFDVTLAVASNFVPDPDVTDTVDILFKNVPTSGTYSLSYIGDDGEERVLFESVPFSTRYSAGPEYVESAE
jgi:hypothetical protein